MEHQLKQFTVAAVIGKPIACFEQNILKIGNRVTLPELWPGGPHFCFCVHSAGMLMEFDEHFRGVRLYLQNPGREAPNADAVNLPLL